MILYLGIDPGKGGAAALVDANGVLEGLCNFDKVGMHGFYEWLEVWAMCERIHGLMERVGARAPGQCSMQTMFKLGEAYGKAQAYTQALGVPLEFVEPRKWQKAYTRGHKPRDYNDRKKILHQAAKRLYPRDKFLKPEADALLIAHYAASLRMRPI